MNYSENDNQKYINSILAFAKLGALLIGIVIISYEILDRMNLSSSRNHVAPPVAYYGFFMLLLLTIYLVWSFFYLNRSDSKHCKGVLIIETFILIIFFTVLNILSNSYTSDFKYLFLFVIVSSVIELGSRFGIAAAITSSIAILSIDLIYAPPAAVNTYFQNDLILAMALVLVAWTLGKYVDLQSDNIDKKNEQLQLLNVKLTEQEFQRKYIENMILKNETCYNLLINNSTNAIFVHRDNKLIFSNERAAQLIGLQLETLANNSILDFVPLEDKDNITNKYERIYKSQMSTISFDQKIIEINGKETIVHNTSTCFIYEGKPTILTILHDITSEKQVEMLREDVQRNIQLLNETREFNKLITEFFSNISHELKTPLNIIFSSVQLLDFESRNKMDNLIQNKDKYLGIMKQNCYRLMRLINNLLDISRADSGFLIPQMKNYNIVSVVEDITMSVAAFAESKGITLIFDTDCEERIMAFDPDKIERIILNLLSNAVKFTNFGGQILVTIFDSEDYVTLSIKDNGIGIPNDKIQLIFQRFRQVDRTFTRSHEGSGIGLSLVKSFVEMHEGIVEVKSELNIGSEFIIKLPVKLCSEDHANEKYVDDSIIERISIEFSDIYS